MYSKPDFTAQIEEIANYIGQEVYSKDFPIVDENHPVGGKLNRNNVMKKSPPRLIHGFDNATRSAALLPVIVTLLWNYYDELPKELQKQLDALDNQGMKALQIVALMRASGRHYNPTLAKKNFIDNPDFGPGIDYAQFGETECLAMLKELGVPETDTLKHQKLAHAIVSNEYMDAKYATSSDQRIKDEHTYAQQDLYSLLLNAVTVLETTRDLKKATKPEDVKTVDLNWIGLFQILGDQGKKDFTELSRNHVEFIRKHQGFLWTKTVVGSKVIAEPDWNQPPKDYNGAQFVNAKQMFKTVREVHRPPQPIVEPEEFSAEKKKVESSDSSVPVKKPSILDSIPQIPEGEKEGNTEPKDDKINDEDDSEESISSENKENFLSNISMMVIGGFITALGIAAVAVAFTVLLSTPVGMGVVAAVGIACIPAGVGLFAVGLRSFNEDQKSDIDNLIKLN